MVINLSDSTELTFPDTDLTLSILHLKNDLKISVGMLTESSYVIKLFKFKLKLHRTPLASQSIYSAIFSFKRHQQS